MPVVTNQVLDPAGTAAYPCTVTIRLITASTGQPGYTSTGDIVGTIQLATDPTGSWTATLVANSLITPSNTYYQVTERGMISSIVVPNGAGPYSVPNILATPPPTPNAPGITGVAVQADGTTAGTRATVNLISGTDIAVTGADNSGSGRVDLTISASRAGVFNVKTYGAKGDNTTDDTTAIRNAITAAHAWGVSTGLYTATLYFPYGIYLIGGAAIQGGATFGNAQLPLPVDSTTGQAFTWRLIGDGANTKPWHWQQTTNQLSGSTIRSTSTATYDATYGQPSVIGGPTPEQGYGRTSSLFSNTNVVIDDLNIVVPNNPSISGIDLAGIAGCRIGKLALRANVTPATVTLPTNSNQVGIRFPDNNNNDSAYADDLLLNGHYTGAVTNEHLIARSIKAIYNLAAINHGRGGDTAHGARIDWLSVEQCQVGIGFISASYPAKIDVGLLDWENTGGAFTTFAVINDPSNVGYGTIRVTTIGLSSHLAYNSGGGSYCVRGAANLRIYDETYQQGWAGAVTVPATNTDTMNPYFRDMALTVTGGTVTAIWVDGHATGLTSGTVVVPTNKSFRLVYSVAPTLFGTLL